MSNITGGMNNSYSFLGYIIAKKNCFVNSFILLYDLAGRFNIKSWYELYTEFGFVYILWNKKIFRESGSNEWKQSIKILLKGSL